jgi:hypothetical protein
MKKKDDSPIQPFTRSRRQAKPSAHFGSHVLGYS